MKYGTCSKCKQDLLHNGRVGYITIKYKNRIGINKTIKLCGTCHRKMIEYTEDRSMPLILEWLRCG